MENTNDVPKKDSDLSEEEMNKFKHFLHEVYRDKLQDKSTAEETEAIKKTILWNDKIGENPVLMQLVADGKFNVLSLTKSESGAGTAFQFVIEPVREGKETRLVGGLLTFDSAGKMEEILGPRAVAPNDPRAKHEFGQRIEEEIAS